MKKANSEKPSTSSSKLKTQLLLQKKTWNLKRNLVEKRLISLTQTQMRENADSGKAIVPITSSRHKVKTSRGSFVGVSNSTEDRAREIAANLPDFPTCWKLMLPSHVSGGFWLSLPREFCTSHLPNNDATVVLVDENEKEYETKYLITKNGLSGGWRGFSTSQGLIEGDVVIFQLVEPCKLKVYIVRAKRLTELDGAVGLLSLDSHANAKAMFTDHCTPDKIEDGLEENKWPNETENLMYEDQHLLPSSKVTKMLTMIPVYDPAMDKSDIESDHSSDINSVAEMLEGIRFSQSVVKFEDVKKFEDFTIHVDGLILDSEIQTHIRKKYYELCSSQDKFLHENLMEGLNCQLATGVISETINIADGIREVKSAASVNRLETWDRTLKAFEDLGMTVGFLRDRIRKLVNIYRESQAAVDLKRLERDEAEHEMRCIEDKLRSVRSLVNRLDSDIQDLTEKRDRIDSEFMEVAGASW